MDCWNYRFKGMVAWERVMKNKKEEWLSVEALSAAADLFPA